MKRRRWFVAAAVGLVVVALVALILIPPAASRRQAKQAARVFWRAVTARDVQAVARMMAPGADQTAEAIVADFGGYSYGGAADAVSAQGSRTVDLFVVVGLISPDGYTHMALTALIRADGKWLVLHAGEGYTETPPEGG